MLLAAMLRTITELQLRCGDFERRIARLEAMWSNAEQSADDLRAMAVLQ